MNFGCEQIRQKSENKNTLGEKVGQLGNTNKERDKWRLTGQLAKTFLGKRNFRKKKRRFG